MSLCGKSSDALERDLVTGKQYSCVSASTTWIGVATCVKNLLPLIPLYISALLSSNPCLPLIPYSSIMLGLAIGCKTFFG
jgi:hypothetical protein